MNVNSIESNLQKIAARIPAHFTLFKVVHGFEPNNIVGIVGSLFPSSRDYYENSHPEAKPVECSDEDFHAMLVDTVASGLSGLSPISKETAESIVLEINNLIGIHSKLYSNCSMSVDISNPNACLEALFVWANVGVAYVLYFYADV